MSVLLNSVRYYLVVLCAVEHSVKAERGKGSAFSLVELVLELNPENEVL